ncbi:MAG: LUD domain-containing protein [Haloarculaceae archaeon]
MTATSTDTYDQFAAAVGEYDVELTRVGPQEARDVVADLVDPPAVGAPLPWEAVSLPGEVTTDPTPAELDAAATGVTGATLAVADYGSVFLPNTADGAEPASLFPDLHVVVLREADIVPDMDAAFDRLAERAREHGASGVLATGPSATADMGELVRGAHGPKAVHGVVLS